MLSNRKNKISNLDNFHIYEKSHKCKNIIENIAKTNINNTRKKVIY